MRMFAGCGMLARTMLTSRFGTTISYQASANFGFDFFFEFQNPNASTKRFECELFFEKTP